MPFDSLPVTNLAIDGLREGRARIERGWCQGQAHDPYANAYCLIGSISRPRSEVVQYLIRAAGIRAWSLVMWNDTPGRTQAEVLALYDRATELALAEELERANAA